MKKIKAFAHFEGARNFDEYGPNYRKPVIQELEDILLEIFDKYKLSESPQGVSRDYSWWNDMNYHITIGNIPDESLATSISDDLFRIKEKIEQRLNRKVSIKEGSNHSDRTYWISILPK